MDNIKWVNANPDCTKVTQVVARKVGMPIEEFLNPKRDPYLENADAVSERIIRRIKEQKPIRIMGDYDADGIMSAFILWVMITEKQKELNLPVAPPEVRFPRRFSEGYGLSQAAVDETKDGTLLICVDNGIAALDPIKAAKNRGLEVLIIDHHMAVKSGELPPADIICDPNALPGSEYNDYCAAGLSYRIAKMVVPNSPKMPAMLIAASVATVTDVVKLHGDNRNILIDGLGAANQRKGTVGFNMLFDENSLHHIDEISYGFIIGPMFNAPGRLYDDGPEKAFNLVIQDPQVGDADYDDAVAKIKESVKELKHINELRKQIVNVLENIANGYVVEHGFDLQGDERKHKAAVLFLESDNPEIAEKQEGVNGIIAGHLAETLKIPCIVFSRHGDSVLKGSGRTAHGIHLKNLLDSVSEYLLGYGGHAGAAGLAIEEKNLEAFQNALDEALRDTDVDAGNNEVTYDLCVPAQDVPTAIREVEKCAPYGEGNPALVFYIPKFELSPRNGKFYREMGSGKEHIKLYGNGIDAVGFSLGARYQDDGCPKMIDILGSLGLNYFNGHTFNQISIVDYRVTPDEKRPTPEYEKIKDLLVFE